MKAVILAGGLGTRLSEETHLKPKPMVEIGGRPILWHVLKIYSTHGINDFVILRRIQRLHDQGIFRQLLSSHVRHHLRHEQQRYGSTPEKCRTLKITVVDTGDETMTGGRIKRVKDYIGDETFCCTYGDGLGDINIAALIDFHKRSGRLATITGVQPPGRFGALDLDEDKVLSFEEKPQGDGAWINGGFLYSVLPL